MQQCVHVKYSECTVVHIQRAVCVHTAALLNSFSVKPPPVPGEVVREGREQGHILAECWLGRKQAAGPELQKEQICPRPIQPISRNIRYPLYVVPYCVHFSFLNCPIFVTIFFIEF